MSSSFAATPVDTSGGKVGRKYVDFCCIVLENTLKHIRSAWLAGAAREIAFSNLSATFSIFENGARLFLRVGVRWRARVRAGPVVLKKKKATFFHFRVISSNLTAGSGCCNSSSHWNYFHDFQLTCRKISMNLTTSLPRSQHSQDLKIFFKILQNLSGIFFENLFQQVGKLNVLSGNTITTTPEGTRGPGR